MTLRKQADSRATSVRSRKSDLLRTMACFGRRQHAVSNVYLTCFGWRRHVECNVYMTWLPESWRGAAKQHEKCVTTGRAVVSVVKEEEDRQAQAKSHTPRHEAIFAPMTSCLGRTTYRTGASLRLSQPQIPPSSPINFFIHFPRELVQFISKCLETQVSATVASTRPTSRFVEIRRDRL